MLVLSRHNLLSYSDHGNPQPQSQPLWLTESSLIDGQIHTFHRTTDQIYTPGGPVIILSEHEWNLHLSERAHQSARTP